MAATQSRHRHWWGVLAALVLAITASTAPAGNVDAVDYNNTNPGATPCGDGSHAVKVLRNFYVKAGGLAYARLELRWSAFCNTVWIKAVNITGSGTGYATERSLTSDEKITVYNCPRSTCDVHTQTEINDVLPGHGDAGWSHQFVLPANGSLGSPVAKQPPSIKGRVTITTGGNNYFIDTEMEPVWTWYANGFQLERAFRDDGTVMSCHNSPDRCVTQAPANVWYELDASLNNPPGSADLVADVKNVLLPAWSERTADTPQLSWCSTPCTEQVMVRVVAAGDIDLGLGYAVTVRDGGFPAGTPTTFNHQIIKIKNKTYDHGCGTTDNGCGPGTDDDRPLISHEIGHTLGLGHCDINFGVMCHVKATISTEITEGTMYWTPQTFEVRALQAFYP